MSVNFNSVGKGDVDGMLRVLAAQNNQLLDRLAPENQTSYVVKMNPATFIAGYKFPFPIQTAGENNHITVSLRTNCVLYLWFSAEDPNNNPTEPDQVFTGPTGNPIPIPYKGNRAQQLTLWVHPSSVQGAGGTIIFSNY